MPFVIIQYLVAAAAALGAFLLFRRMPIEWLLDYGEKRASAELYRKQQIPFTPYAIGLTGASVLAVFFLRQKEQPGIVSVISFLICLLLFLIMIADSRTRIIPDQFLLLLVPSALLLWFFSERSLVSLLIRLAAALGGGGLLLLISWLGYRIMKQEAMGMGDVKLLAAAGLITGFPGILMVFVLAFVIASLPALVLLIMRRIKPETDGSLAFGPYISLAVILVLLFEQEIIGLWNWWLNMAAGAV
ncbi:MAG: prepilin peptidase [Clostridiaceae bacterium]|nr:prepilin peptidase [Clostridiaceae bacterium]